MAHDHSNHHHNAHPGKLNAAFIVGIILNSLFVLVEVVEGLHIHSLSLLADAGHNLADVGALALSLLAFRLLSYKPSKNYTYGFKKTSVLVALLNAMVLLLSMGAITYEAVHRLINPQPLPGMPIAIVAGIGIFVNAISALFFMRDKDKDLNVKSAYLHLMSDAAVSLALVAGGIIIYFTQYYWMDSALSLVVVVVIMFNTWKLLKDSLRLSLDGVPANIEVDTIRTMALKLEGVKDLHHIHIWALSTTENALTAHLVLMPGITMEEEQGIKHNLKHELAHRNIHHITLETERGTEACPDEECSEKE